jgi:hypothetical protein
LQKATDANSFCCLKHLNAATASIGKAEAESSFLALENAQHLKANQSAWQRL